MTPRQAQRGFGLAGRSADPFRRPAGFGAASWTSEQPLAMPAASVPAPAAAFYAPPAARHHPLADQTISQALRHRAEEIAAAFDAIEPVLRELAPRQFEEGFARRATAEVLAKLHLDFSADVFAAAWTAPLDMGALYARCVVGTFCRLIERAFDRSLADISDGESVDVLVQRWGFHAVDITPCADGRLSGVVDYILRIPPSVVAYRKSYAGALFDVTESVRHWESTELRRWREAVPNAANVPTQYLKICVYHFSSVDPNHEGCAAHGSDDTRAASALLERLGQFALAVHLLHGDDASVATLLVGVDTDTDAIRVHVPDSNGRMDVGRYLDSNVLYDSTAALPRDAAKEAIRMAVAACAGVSLEDVASTGMRWFCGYLLKNNIAQVDAVREWHGGHYQDVGHTERLIVVGDAADDVQLRNLAFQAQMATVEEGAPDLDIGISILRRLNETRGLATPLLVHLRADPRIPGSVQRAQCHAKRLAAAIVQRYADRPQSGRLYVQAIVRDGANGALLPVDLTSAPPQIMEAH
jgi:carboxysome shell carbonic anhydrase